MSRRSDVWAVLFGLFVTGACEKGTPAPQSTGIGDTFRGVIAETASGTDGHVDAAEAPDILDVAAMPSAATPCSVAMPECERTPTALDPVDRIGLSAFCVRSACNSFVNASASIRLCMAEALSTKTPAQIRSSLTGSDDAAVPMAYEPTAAASCAALLTQSCDGVHFTNRTECAALFRGLAPDSAPCTIAQECSGALCTCKCDSLAPWQCKLFGFDWYASISGDGWCVRPDADSDWASCVGAPKDPYCQFGPIAVGEPCNPDEKLRRCAEGAWCWPDGLCHPLRKLGEKCTITDLTLRGSIRECVLGTVCAAGSSSGAAACLPEVKRGEACGSSWQCASVDDECRSAGKEPKLCAPLPVFGQPCQQAEPTKGRLRGCQFPWTCNPVKLKCAAAPQVGESCSPALDLHDGCAPGLECVDSICRAQGLTGDVCSGKMPCHSLLTCVDQQCLSNLCAP